MTRHDQLRWTLLAGLVALSLGGWLLHLRAHPLSGNGANWVPFLTGIVSVVVIPALFCFKRTLPWGYLANGMIVIVGSIMMAHFSIARLAAQPGFPGLDTILLKTTFPDIAMLWAKLMMGKALFDASLKRGPDEQVPAGRFWRWPNMGFWYAHFLGWAAVYAAGAILWR